MMLCCNFSSNALSCLSTQKVLIVQETCPWSTIMLFGHSIGGYVARLTPILYPETRKSITNIITLGSPHRSPVFGWESSIYKLHQQYLARVRQDEEPPVLIAISGGLRDEMIPPVACNADEEDHSISKLAPMIMDPGPNDLKPTLGMDHRCIVSCIIASLLVVLNVLYH